MKRLKQATVGKGRKKGRVLLTLQNADQKFQAWLDPAEAEQLAADIFACRFDLPAMVIVKRHKFGIYGWA